MTWLCVALVTPAAAAGAGARAPPSARRHAATTLSYAATRCHTPATHPRVVGGSVQPVGLLHVGQRRLVLAQLLVRLGAAHQRLGQRGQGRQGSKHSESACGADGEQADAGRRCSSCGCSGKAGAAAAAALIAAAAEATRQLGSKRAGTLKKAGWPSSAALHSATASLYLRAGGGPAGGTIRGCTHVIRCRKRRSPAPAMRCGWQQWPPRASAPLVHHVAGGLVGVQQRGVSGVGGHQLERLVVAGQRRIVLLLGKVAVAVGLELGQRLEVGAEGTAQRAWG